MRNKAEPPCYDAWVIDVPSVADRQTLSWTVLLRRVTHTTARDGRVGWPSTGSSTGGATCRYCASRAIGSRPSETWRLSVG
jgi:hypothetical protein